jgi:hypothetical protein
MTHYRPHHLAPNLLTAKVILVCRDFGGSGVSHVGLRISADYTAKTLMGEGIWAEAWSTKTANELTIQLRKAKEAAIARNEVRPSHIVISAPWIEPVDLAKLAGEFPEIHFIVVSHSCVGFLSADPHAIKILKEVANMQMTSHNIFVGGNSLKFTSWATDTWGIPVMWCPNLYCMKEVFSHRDRNWSPGSILRIGIFGANRPLKNHVCSAAAAAELAIRYGTPVEVYLSTGRNEGGSPLALAEMLDVRNIAVKPTGWLNWPAFRKLLRTMDIVMQPSFTESFNVVAADSIAEGVPVVVSETIDWVPRWWQAVADDPQDIARVADTLLRDPTTSHQGRIALRDYVDRGIAQWKRVLYDNNS